jgi:hypothetical protein
VEFGDSDGQLEGVESELGIDRDWEADMEGDYGRMVYIVGHKEALEMTLRDWINDIDNADRSGLSRRTDFSQSTGNSTNNTDATMHMHTHRERALTTITLVNKNSTLTNNLEDTKERLSAMITQNLILQGQLTAVSNNAHDTSNNISQEQDGNTRMDEEGPNMIQGRGDQGSGSKHSEESPESQMDDRDWFRGCHIWRKQGPSLRLHWLISLLYSVIHEQRYHRIPKFQRISLSSSQTFYHLVGDIMFLFLVLGDG